MDKQNDYMTKRQSIWYLVFLIAGAVAFIAWVFLPDDFYSLPILGLLFSGMAQDIRVNALTRALNNTERLATDALTKAHRS